MATIDELNAETARIAAKTELVKLEAAKKEIWWRNLQLLFVCVIAAAILYGILGSNGEFLLKLKDVETSRGMITFLVAATTVSIALTISVYVLTSGATKEDVKERFGHAKDVLATLVGILGTVLGFYYGSLSESREQSIAVDANIHGNQLVALITGSSPPYTYVISLPGQDPQTRKAQVTKDRWIVEPLPGTLKNGDLIQIELTDQMQRKVAKTIEYLAPGSASKADGGGGENQAPVAVPAVPAEPPVPAPVEAPASNSLRDQSR